MKSLKVGKSKSSIWRQAKNAVARTVAEARDAAARSLNKECDEMSLYYDVDETHYCSIKDFGDPLSLSSAHLNYDASDHDTSPNTSETVSDNLALCTQLQEDCGNFLCDDQQVGSGWRWFLGYDSDSEPGLVSRNDTHSSDSDCDSETEMADCDTLGCNCDRPVSIAYEAFPSLSIRNNSECSTSCSLVQLFSVPVLFTACLMVLLVNGLMSILCLLPVQPSLIVSTAEHSVNMSKPSQLLILISCCHHHQIMNNTYKWHWNKCSYSCLLNSDRSVMFAIVEFVDDCTIDVVPCNWLTESKGVCFWPPFRAERLISAIKKSEEPQEFWAKCSVRVINSYG
jgi:hypothetical protein